MKKKIKYVSLLLIFAFFAVFFINVISSQKDITAKESSDRFEKRYKEIIDTKLDRPIDKQQLKDTTATDAFKYFSGNTMPAMNHPAIYAAGNQLIVVGYEYHKEFPIEKIQKAIKAYKELLKQEGLIEENDI